MGTFKYNESIRLRVKELCSREYTRIKTNKLVKDHILNILLDNSENNRKTP